MSRSLLRAIVSMMITAAGCSGPTDLGPAVVTRIEVERAVVTPGDRVLLRAIATNHGTQSVQAGYGCGPGLDFEVRFPSGEVRHLLRGLPSTCPIHDSNVLEPGETDTVTYQWAPSIPSGTYRIVAGVQTASGLRARSGPVNVVVGSQ